MATAGWNGQAEWGASLCTGPRPVVTARFHETNPVTVCARWGGSVNALKYEQWLTQGRRGSWFFYMFINC